MLLLAGLAVVLAAAAAGLWGTLRTGSYSGSGKCVTFTFASSTGGNTTHRCGAAARTWCDDQFTGHDVLAKRAQVACRQAGFGPVR
ncbi:MAG: hypothetical protein J2O39_09745 [Acidimicrobiales bacterium]|nr:hypothetical protein [Acidimicrobiales bacterium]MBO0886222.1 hypothetical protein [Acidimicrobiales bacterium]MBO0894650.1 hypothetical protein [Acidimicrobiales bacterium]